MPLRDSKYGRVYNEAEVVNLVNYAADNKDLSVGEIIEKFNQLVDTDELCFVIRAKDELSSNAVEAYGNLAAANGLPPLFVADVRNCADSMRTWQRNNPDKVKLPD